MKKIIVATDFSRNAENALNYATQLAKDFKAELVIFHSYMLDVSTPDPTANMVMAESQEEVCLKDLEDTVKSIRADAPGLKVSSELRMGAAVEEVCYLADEIKADLIICGLRGQSNLADRLLGSTASGIIRRANRAVLAVPDSYRFHAPENIIFACDYQNVCDISVFNTLKDITARYNAKVLTLNVVNKGEYATEGVSQGVNPMTYLESIPGNRTFAFDMDTDEELDKYMEEHPADMLVMVPHQHGFFHRLFEGSHTRRMTMHTKVPLLCLPDKK